MTNTVARRKAIIERIIEVDMIDKEIAAAIAAFGEAAMRFAEGHTTLQATELDPARSRLEEAISRLKADTVSLRMYEDVRRERDAASLKLAVLTAKLEVGDCGYHFSMCKSGHVYASAEEENNCPLCKLGDTELARDALHAAVKALENRLDQWEKAAQSQAKQADELEQKLFAAESRLAECHKAIRDVLGSERGLSKTEGIILRGALEASDVEKPKLCDVCSYAITPNCDRPDCPHRVVEKCAYCAGQGIVVVSHNDEPSFESECPMCDGDGLMKRDRWTSEALAKLDSAVERHDSIDPSRAGGHDYLSIGGGVSQCSKCGKNFHGEGPDKCPGGVTT